MKILKTDLNGVLILEPEVYNDDRGYFIETWNNRMYNSILSDLNDNFVQDNESCSKKGVARGMHWQISPMDQSKFVRCTNGKVIDIIVDITIGSPTFGNCIYVELSRENHRQVFIPRGFAHGFISLEDNSILQYKVDNYYSKEHERSFNFSAIDLSNFNLDFDNIILSDKDMNAPAFNELTNNDLKFSQKYNLITETEINGETGSNNS